MLALSIITVWALSIWQTVVVHQKTTCIRTLAADTPGPFTAYLVGLLALSFLMFLSCKVVAQEQASEDPLAQQMGTNTDRSTDTRKGSESKARLDNVQIREMSADEDPLNVDQVKREVERVRDNDPGSTSSVNERPLKLDAYSSIRLRYRSRSGNAEWQDGSSRVGAISEWQFRDGSFVFARYEAGFNVLSDLDNIINSGEARNLGSSSVFTRLAYVGLDTPGGAFVAGKNWSSYYEVAGFTDRFMGAGGNAGGAYNAQTDGGLTGPGRADRSLQSKFSLDLPCSKNLESLQLNFQVQHGNTIPFGGAANYGIAGGLSAVITTNANLSFGIATNYASVDLEEELSLREIGISGSARATVVGMRAFGKRWYAGAIVARLKNHETTDDGIYFHGWGSEFYGQYEVLDRVWLTGGFNVLKPDENQYQAGQYRIKYAVAGLRYTFDSFRRMLFANIRLDDSETAGGLKGGNIYTIGVRWDLSGGWTT